MKSEFQTQSVVALERSWVLDYLTLTKPELTFLSVLTALAGFYLGSAGSIAGPLLMHTLVGTALVGGGAGALNQYRERRFDAMMRRTENRPLPAGRLTPTEALVFGIIVSVVGVAELSVFVNALTGLLAATTWSTYLFLYTPLKRITPFCTIVGAIPGAIPPVMGWTAARKELSFSALVLFAILFFWQMPHFLSLAWMYRKDYARAGYRLLTVLDQEGSTTGRHVVGHAGALLLVSLMPVALGELGWVYGVCAFVLGAVFTALGVGMYREKSNLAARRLFVASLLYLPTLIAVMIVDKL